MRCRHGWEVSNDRRPLPNPLPRPAGRARAAAKVWEPPRGWRILMHVNNTGGRPVVHRRRAAVPGARRHSRAASCALQLATPENDLVDHDLYNQLFTMHGSVMMFLFAVPVVEAIGILLLPAMQGARDLPFPRLSAYAFWAYFVGGLVFFTHDLFRSRAGRRLVHVSAADELRVLARTAHRLLVARHRLHRDLRDRRRDRDRRRHPAHATAGHDARQDADLPVGDADRRRDDHLRLSAGDSRDGAARAGARLSLAVLHRGAGRRSAAVAAPVLAVRSSGRLHHFSARRGTGVDDRRDDGAHAAGGLSLDRRRDARRPARSRSRCGCITCSRPACRTCR